MLAKERQLVKSSKDELNVLKGLLEAKITIRLLKLTKYLLNRCRKKLAEITKRLT